MNNSLTDVASLKHEIISWLDDMFPARIPESPRTENPEIVVVSNRIMTIPKLVCSNIYMFLASRMMTDELRGLDLVVCMGLEAYGLEPAWGEKGCPTHIEYLDFLGELHAAIEDHPEMEDA